MLLFQNSYSRPLVWVANWRIVAFVLGARNFGLSPSKPSKTLISENSGRMSSTGDSGSSLPRSIKIIAAVDPTALVIENILKTVSCTALRPGAASPAAPE